MGIKTSPGTEIGIGFRVPNYDEIFSSKPSLDFFEIISENFFNPGSQPQKNLCRLLNDYPVVLHGVSLSLASTEPPDFEYLKKLKELCKLTKTPYFTDHLCWTRAHQKHYYDLLPLPYTEKNANFIAEKIKIVQDFINLPFGLENLSSYLSFTTSEMTEWEFLNLIVEKSGCHYMLDINNIYVSAINQNFDPVTYLHSIKWKKILQCHIAGHTKNMDGSLHDTHDHPVCPEVWELYELAWKLSGGFRTLLEWDEKIPPLDILVLELLKARNYQNGTNQQKKELSTETQSHSMVSLDSSIKINSHIFKSNGTGVHNTLYPDSLTELQGQLGTCITSPPDFSDTTIQFPEHNYSALLLGQLSPHLDTHIHSGLSTYNKQYWFRLFHVLQNEFPLTCRLLGSWFFNQCIVHYISTFPLNSYDLNNLGYLFPQWIKEYYPNWELQYPMGSGTLPKKWPTLQLFNAARFERDFTESLTADQRLVTSNTTFASVNQEELLFAKIRIHPLVKIYEHDLDYVPVFHQLRIHPEDDFSFSTGPFYWVMFPDQGGICTQNIPALAYKILIELKNWTSLIEVCENLSTLLNPEELTEMQENLTQWFRMWSSLNWLEFDI